MKAEEDKEKCGGRFCVAWRCFSVVGRGRSKVVEVDKLRGL